MRVFQCVSYLLLSCVALSNGHPVDVDSDKTKPDIQSPFEVTEIKGSNIVGTWIENKATGECISIVNQKGVGGFIQFHEKRSAYPKLVISAHGIQIVDDKGLIHWVTPDELLALDRDKGIRQK